MFRRIISCNQLVRTFSMDTKKEKLKIAICGAAGKVGRSVSFFLKQSRYNVHISLYDVANVLFRITRELQFVNTSNTFESFCGPLKLRYALKNADIILIALKSHVQNKSLEIDGFEANFPSVANIAKCAIEVCPDAIFAVATNPINCIVPAINEIYNYSGILHAHKLFGLTSPDSMQASVVYADVYDMDSGDVFIPLTGGATSDSMVPIFSQATPNGNARSEIYPSDSDRLYTTFLQNKLLMPQCDFANGFAIFRFIESLIRALLGEKDIVETAFVAAPDGAPAKFMTSLIDLDAHGIETVYGQPLNVNRYEKKLLYPAMINLQRDIVNAEKYVVACRKAEGRMRH